jgi:4-amino-4-deoxy-L-arabinose transferase-like glycosyltransferase
LKRYKILLPLILLAFFLRVWQLPAIPPGLWYDEAYYSMDAAWLLDGGPWQLFFAGNNGREPLFIYLQAVFIWIFGAHPFTSRLIGPLAGTLTIPLMYILARRLFKAGVGCQVSGVRCQVSGLRSQSPISNLLSAWLPYVATAALATSFWHISLSRGGFRGILLPLAAGLVFYAFWRGWHPSLKGGGIRGGWIALAGFALGLSQYTYLSARALPLVFAGFALVWTALNWRDSARRNNLWLALVIMALVSAVVFAPLGWIFYQNPALFSARTGDVFFTPDTPGDLLQHLVAAVRLFVDGGDPNWRHHLPGRPMLGWLGWLGFWPGLIVCLRRFRRDACLFLVSALLILFLPALLAVPPIHALRLSALLPIYFIIFALGLTEVSRITYHVSRITFHVSPLSPLLLITVLLIETGLTTFDYFYRWARAEETYVEYNGPLVDFINHVIAQTGDTAVAIPFQLYVHPTTRYLLRDYFTEQPVPADALNGPVRLVTLPNDFRMLNVGNIPTSPAWVWLSHRADGRGAAYVSRPPRPAEQAILDELAASSEPEIYRDRFGSELAHLRTLADPAPLLPIFTETTPERTISLNWANLAKLTGYDVLPAVIRPGQPLTLNLYWRSLTDATFDSRLFLQIIDRAGKPLNQWEGEAFREDMYRWRPNGILPSQHTLWVGPEAAPGPYLVRLGFFDDRTGQRLPLYTSLPLGGTEGGPIDQIHLGLFYVSPDGRDPRLPATPLSATFADSIQLIGVTLPDFQNSLLPTSYSLLPVTFHWQTLQPTDRPYTVFLQLLNEQGEVVSSWDSQPLNGLYPTNLWSPGEIIADTFALPLPDTGLPPGDYRLITGFYEVETGQRLPVDSGGDFAELVQFAVE